MKKKTLLILLMLLGLGVSSFGHSSSQESTKLRILLSNDDGINATGLEVLAKKLAQVAYIDIVAPSRNQSAVSQALTLEQPLLVSPIKQTEKENWFAADTTPATCIKLGLELLLKVKPDLVVSGINKGDNLGVMTFSSGTVGCAREAFVKGIPAIAVSLDKGKLPEKENAYLEDAADFLIELITEMREKGWKNGRYLNINYPSLPRQEIKGVAAVRQDTRPYPDYVFRPYLIEGKYFIWYDFKTIDAGTDENTDSWRLRNGYITVTPLSIDQTDSDVLENLKTWRIFEAKSPALR